MTYFEGLNDTFIYSCTSGILGESMVNRIDKESTSEPEELAVEFSVSTVFSRALWNVFREVINGNNYASKIAKKLKKSKSIIARQLKTLEELKLLNVHGEGVKQWYEINWENLLRYWIYGFSPVIDVFLDFEIEFEDIPKEFREPYLTEEEWKVFKSTKPQQIEKEALKALPILVDVAKVYFKSTCSFHETFWDALSSFTRALLIAIQEIGKEIDLSEIEDKEKRRLLKSLFSPRITLWLKLLTWTEDYGAYLVRNVLISKYIGVEQNESKTKKSK